MLLAALAGASIVRFAEGHGFLVEPPARNVYEPTRNGYCPHCGNGGSKAAPGSVCGDGNQWPSNSNYVSLVQDPHRTYTAGQVVEFEVSMNVNHKGHHEFFICDHAISNDTGAVECLQKWPLMRVLPEEMHSDCVVNDPREDCQPIDPNYPGRWYHPTGMPVHKIHYRIPESLQCEHCTLQWFWPTANSEAYDAASYSCYNKQLKELGWSLDFCGWACSDSNCPEPYARDPSAPAAPDPSAGPGYEEFRNCADIRVLASGSVPSPAPPAPAPIAPAPPAPTPPVPAPSPPVSPMPTPTPPASAGTCEPIGDCSADGWCNADAYSSWCAV